MDAAERIRPAKPPGTWLVAIACLGMGLNVLAFPGMLIILAGRLVGWDGGPTELNGVTLRLEVELLMATLLIASVLSVFAIALRPGPLTYRVVLALAVGWVAFQILSWSMDIASPWTIVWQLGIVALLVAGRAPFTGDRGAR